MELVSVICLCYNHAAFIEEAVDSVAQQTYKNIELIIVNDASTDNCRNIIQKLCIKYPFIQFIDNAQNMGMCRSFNNALKAAKGDFIVDFAADDILLPERIEKQVNTFRKLDASWGVVFTDALIVNEKGKTQQTFYRRNEKMELLEPVISGDIFSKVVQRYQICSPTMLVRKSVFDKIGGYDPNLNYEDYDFFIRTSRDFKYYFLDDILTKRREVEGSDSGKWYRKNNNTHLESTLTVLKKYLWLSRDKHEMLAALPSIRYHMRQALFTECFQLSKKHFQLLKSLDAIHFSDRMVLLMASVKAPLHLPYKVFRFIRR